MRTFTLEREEDVSGVSGVGTVAEGVEFTDGSVVLKWLGQHSSLVIWPSIKEVEIIHGHDGRTKVAWTSSDGRPEDNRVVHGSGTDLSGGYDVVRYNRTSKYYLEYGNGARRQVSLAQAVEAAERGFVGRTGGTAFDREWLAKAGF